LALLLALGQVPALAATINVQGGCTLVDAITSANEDTAVGACTKGSGADTLVLPANSTQTLDTVNTYTYDQGGATGLPEITSTITIQGNGATIERAANAPDFRIFSVFRGNLILQQTTISGGELSNPDEDPYEAGGAIAVYYDGATLTLTDSTITGNRSEFGGGIFNYGGAIDITNSTISGNTGVATLLPEQPQGTAGVGGGIYNLYGAADIDNSTISGNSAAYGGGFMSWNLTAISGDTSKYAAGPVTLTNSIISDNKASKEGGGIFNVAGTIDLSESTVSGNSAGTTGGGIYSGGYFEVETNELIKVTNSTISGNSAKQSGGGMYIDNQGGSAEVINSTITDNAAEKAGGVYVEADALGITLARALIAGNNAAAVREVFVGNDVPVTVANFNVFGYSGDAGIKGFSPGPTDLVPQAPLEAILDTNLANNGGPTQTHALPPGSPAVDAVTDGTCPPPDTDQRGVERPQDGNNDGAAICDIGAYELE
jgi:predicted outer membrane repeat protein